MYGPIETLSPYEQDVIEETLGPLLSAGHADFLDSVAYSMPEDLSRTLQQLGVS